MERKRPRPDTANGRILAYLEEHGSITTLQIRSMGLSGNPSQRWTELTETYGVRIAKELLHQEDGSPYCRWTFNGFREPGVQVATTDGSQQPAVGGLDSGRPDGAASTTASPAGDADVPAGQLHLLDDKPVKARPSYADADLDEAA